MKRIFSIILLAAMIMAGTLSNFAVLAETDRINTPEERVLSFFEALDEGNWDKLLSQFCPSARVLYESLISNETNHEKNIGILTVDSANVISMTAVGITEAPHYFEIEDYFEIPDAICCYKVETNLTVKEYNGYFSNGTNIFTIVLVKENGIWMVGAITSEIGKANGMRGIGYGFINFSSKPTTIVARDENLYISTVNFDSLVFNATCNEIGNMNYNAEAIAANVMAVKMFAWWAQKGHYRDALGCDIIFGDVAFRSVNLASTSGQDAVQSAMNSVSNFYMVSSPGTGGKLFSANYVAGSYNGNYQGSGILRQNGSNYLASNGYTWQQILHYYYDNSTYNHPDCGVVQIKCITHSYGAYVSDQDNHWKVCSYCGAESAHLTHSWVSHTYYEECSVCGRIRTSSQMRLACIPECFEY